MMYAINIVTAVCFALFTLVIAGVALGFARRDRAGRIDFVRGFKKGKCAIVFVICVPLLSLGYLYDGEQIVRALLDGVQHVVGFVVLKLELGDVAALCDVNRFYRVTLYYGCVLVILNAAMFAASLFGQRVWVWCREQAIRHTRKDKLYIFGNNHDNVNIYKSETVRKAAIVDDIDTAAGTKLYAEKVRFISRSDTDGVVAALFKKLEKRDNNVVVVINTRNDEKNVRIARMFADRISAASDEFKERLFAHLSVNIFGAPEYEAIYSDIVTNSFGCIHFKNKYRMIAMAFVDRHPLTKYMDERHIDYETSLVRKGVDINVCMIGYGRTNRQIFITSVANNQFITMGGHGVELKKVNYHLFDKEYAEHNKNLNHSYYRFKNEKPESAQVAQGDPDYKPLMPQRDYLPFPDLPARETYHHTDINEPKFYTELREVVTANEKDANFVIISFQDDLTNIDMAQKIAEKRREWGVENLVIFVKVRNRQCEHSLFKEKGVIPIGNERERVYRIEEITNDKIFRMAQMRNKVYDLEYNITHDKDFEVTPENVAKTFENAHRNWFMEKTRIERESSLYCCLSLRSKLNMMGLDYCKKDGENDTSGMTEEAYLKRYAKTDLPDLSFYKGKYADDKKIVKYTLDFAEGRRKDMAILEHYRWNSFMLSQGIIPATKEQILKEKVPKKDGTLKYSNGRNYILRRHGNLTTFDGLVTFRQMISERDGTPELDNDVIKYDYQILDDAYWLLEKNGYKIIEKK